MVEGERLLPSAEMFREHVLEASRTQLGEVPVPGDLQNGCMADTNVPTYTLNDGSTLPAIGFGTYPLTGDDGIAAIESALEVGYRLLDTAVNYENEAEVGEALRRSGLPRDQVQVASKLPGRHHAYDDAVASVPRRSSGSVSTTSTCTSSTGPTPASGSTSRPGRHSSTSRSRGWSARSVSPTSPRTT